MKLAVANIPRRTKRFDGRVCCSPRLVRHHLGQPSLESGQPKSVARKLRTKGVEQVAQRRYRPQEVLLTDAVAI